MSRYLNVFTLFCAFVLLSAGGIVGCSSDALNAPSDPINSEASGALLKGSCGNNNSKNKHKGDKDKGDKDKGDKHKGDKHKGDKHKGDKDKGDKDKGDNDKGDNDNGGNNGGGCNEPPAPEYDGCVEPVDYWVDNPESWPPPFTPDGQFCTFTGATFYLFISMPVNECDPNWLVKLSHEYIAALLNKSKNNGNIPPDIQAAINAGQLFFDGRDMRVPLTEAEICEAKRLFALLAPFNDGDGDLAPCDD